MLSTLSPSPQFNMIEVAHSGIHGVGLFSTGFIKRDDVLGMIEEQQVKLKVRDEEESELIKNWIGLDLHLWIDTTHSIFRYINHSCEPNVAILGRKVIATRDIREGDELVMDYSLTDADEHWTIACNCKHASCRRDIGSIFSMSLPDYLRRKHIIHTPFRLLFEQRQQSDSKIDLGLQLQSA
jgi:hypothetical protein